MPRMNILNTVEREAFESPPVFNSVQRKQYFDFPTELRRLAGELRAPTHQLGFLLSAGYFKAAKSFFPPSAFHRRDLEYVERQLELRLARRSEAGPYRITVTGYFRRCWRLEFFLLCDIHGVLLHDSCPACRGLVRLEQLPLTRSPSPPAMAVASIYRKLN